jgi:hypothetical protein
MNNRSINLMVIMLVLACFALSPAARAVSPVPDGCYPNYTTAEGCNALALLSTGVGNTAVGWYSLSSVGPNSFNTGVGAGALALNTADSNTAVGAAAMLLNTSGLQNVANGTEALLSNTTGSYNNAVGAFALLNNVDGSFNNAFGNQALAQNVHASDNTAIGDLAMANNDVTKDNVAYFNTAVGAQALFSNTDGNSNTGVGWQALYNNIDGSFNNAFGNQALFENIYAGDNTAIGDLALANNDVTGNNLAYFNTAVGAQALLFNNDGNSNTAIGWQALYNNFDGNFNTASGYQALFSNLEGNHNTATGFKALLDSVQGDSNTAIGNEAGANVVTASNVTCVGARVAGADVSNTTWIGNVYGVTPQSGTTAPVVVSDTGQLGTAASSERFKKDIATMYNLSEAILSLRPVTFHYKTDTANAPQFGLIAEEVAKVNPALVLPDKQGKPYTVRYDAVNAMLLNEFLKEHRKVEQLEKQIQVLTAGLQKVSAQLASASPSRGALEVTKHAPRTVSNNQ